ncbi:MAG: hypothetical protein JWQ18_1094 [Conexibacter sp.]|nr:hypothetical protein [Conexibacter sp.]
MDPKDQDQEEETRSLPRAFNGQRARAALASLIEPASHPRLVLDAGHVTTVDAYAGAVLRTGIEVHLARDPGNSIVVAEPEASLCWAALYDLLGEFLPPRSSWAGNRPTPTRGRDIVLPATPIADDETTVLLTDVALPAAAGALGFGDHARRLLQEAAAAFIDNARKYGDENAPVGPVICAALEPQSNDLQLVVCDLGSDAPADGQAALRDAVSRSRETLGGIQSLVALRRNGMDLSVRLAFGAGRAHHRTHRAWRFSTFAAVPGFIAGVEIHR